MKKKIINTVTKKYYRSLLLRIKIDLHTYTFLG